MPVGTKLSIAQNRIVMPLGTGRTHCDSYPTACWCRTASFLFLLIAQSLGNKMFTTIILRRIVDD